MSRWTPVKTPLKESQMPTDAPTPSFTDALRALTKADALALKPIAADDGRQHVLIPDGYTLKDITDPHRLHPRPRGMV